MVLNSVLLWFWNDHVGINENLSPIINLIIIIPLNFILNKFWVFEKIQCRIKTYRNNVKSREGESIEYKYEFRKQLFNDKRN